MKPKYFVVVLILILVLTASCSLLSDQQSENPSPEKATEKLCGDGVCDGPENQRNCPEDCKETAAAGVENQSSQEDNTVESQAEVVQDGSGYRYVSFSGEISTSSNFATEPDFTGDYFNYTGEYSVELWFPPSGGEAVQQRNTISLTEFIPLHRGSDECRPCEWEPEAAAYNPLEFTLDAELNLDVYSEGGQAADELVYHLSKVPQKSFSVAVECPCPGQMSSYTDPAAYLQLLSYFMTQTISNPIQLNVLETNSVTDFPVSPLASISIPEENLSYVLVPDLDTP